MANWIVRGTLNGEQKKWKLEAVDERSARGLATSKGVVVTSLAPADPAPAVAIQRVEASRPMAPRERCANCGDPIGVMETKHAFNGEIVCDRCINKLSGPVIGVVASAPAAQPAAVAFNPTIHMPSTNVHVANTTHVHMSRGCLGSIIHSAFKLIAVVVFIGIVVAAVLIYSQVKH